MHDDKEPKTWTHVHINCFDENMQKSGHILAFSFVLSHIEATAASIFYLLNFPNSTKISPPLTFTWLVDLSFVYAVFIWIFMRENLLPVVTIKEK